MDVSVGAEYFPSKLEQSNSIKLGASAFKESLGNMCTYQVCSPARCEVAAFSSCSLYCIPPSTGELSHMLRSPLLTPLSARERFLSQVLSSMPQSWLLWG